MTSSTAPKTSSSPAGALYTNVQRFSIHDGGGIRTVVFLKGCPFRCPWCCNPENLSFSPQVAWHASQCIHCSMPPDASGAASCPRTPAECPTGAKELLGKPADVEALLKVVLRDRVFYEESNGGVTVSGGECLAGPNQAFVLEFLAACRRAGLNTALETTLALPVRDLATLAAVTNTFLVDFKIADREESLRVTGIDPRLRDDNLRRLLSMGARVVARMPVIPGFTDGSDNVRANVGRMRELGIERVDVLPFHQMGESKYDAMGMDYGLRGVPQLGEKGVDDVVAACEEAGLRVVVHGE
ncbi:MAG: radical SAM protein [Parafannyhessea sp.]|jgi:pyruvate formate lyase activating enzyme|uniref:radical SAM protein n=1 Tax=Parafannyhessea sp. TaxID=2847324 RepID=UPI003F02BA93